jgi:hypothetical protein
MSLLTLDDIMNDTAVTSINVRRLMPCLENAATAQLEAALVAMDKLFAIHSFLGKHQEDLIEVAQGIPNSAYMIWACDCGAFYCQATTRGTPRETIWGLAMDDTSYAPIARAIQATNDPIKALMWARYVASVSEHRDNELYLHARYGVLI